MALVIREGADSMELVVFLAALGTGCKTKALVGRLTASASCEAFPLPTG